MNDSEARRRRLLKETRNLYRDDGLPAVHPRYRAAHASLYPDEEEIPKSTLKLRIVLSVLCFVCYLALDSGRLTASHFDSSMIREQISYQMQPNDILTFFK